MMTFGLTEEQINKIKNVIADFPQVEDVLLFGSRAQETQHQGSDIDLALIGEITHKELLNIKSRLNGLNYLFTFDVLVYSDIQNETLKKDIDSTGICFYSNKNTLEE